MKKCERYNKRKYKTEQEARRGAMWIFSHDPNSKIGDLHAYLCEFCNCWHIGHWSKFEKESK